MNLKTIIPIVLVTALGAIYITQIARLGALLDGGPVDPIASVGSVALVDGDGQPRTLADFGGRHSVLFFGYTNWLCCIPLRIHR